MPSLYSYAIPVAGDRNAFLDRLRRELWSDERARADFAWKTNPQTGLMLGRVVGQQRATAECYASAGRAGWR